MPERDSSLVDVEAVLDWLADMGRTLAHDLNQPLAAAANYLSVARQIARTQGSAGGTLDQALDRAAGQIARASDSLGRLAASLTPSEPHLEQTSLHAILRQASERVERRTQAAIELRLDAEDDGLLADPAQIEQALTYLLLTVSEAAPDAVAVLTWAAPGAIRIEILAPPDEERSSPPPVGGTSASVSLALARAILEAHDGALESMPDGDGFAVTLPLAASEPLT